MFPKLNSQVSSCAILGTGEMADLVRAFPWEKSAVGPINSWSKELLSLVHIVLASPLPMFIYWGTESLVIYNDAARPILSIKHPAALGAPANQVWREAWHIVGPEIQRVFATGESVSHESILVPLEKGGKLTDLYWNYSYSPAFEGTASAGVFVVCADVTKAVQDRMALKATAEKLDRVLSVTSDAIFSLDREWRFTFVNPRCYEVIKRGEDVLGTTVWESFPGILYQDSPYVKHYRRAMFEGIAGSFEAFYPEPLNIWVSISVQPTDEGITVFFRDVTEDKSRERLLIRTEKLAAVGRMAASISHEINNPLEAVTNLLYIARSEPDLGKVQALLDDADRELRRVGNIVNQTLRFHRQPSNPTKASSVELISAVLSMYESRLQNAAIQVEKRTRATRTVEVYEGDIRQVLNNLVGNALDAMPRGARLLVRSREATDWRTGTKGLVITVADTGAGIAETDQRHIFEPFFTTKGIGGSGLGLWVSSEIIERHHGRLLFRSRQRSEHHGTVFAVFLPFEGSPQPT